MRGSWSDTPLGLCEGGFNDPKLLDVTLCGRDPSLGDIDWVYLFTV